jgi:phenylacetic acid degradation protein
MTCYAFEGIVPVVHPTAFVHPAAVLIGDVHVGARCYVGPGASLRGDFGRIVVGAGSNVQDNCIMHSFPETDALLEEDSHIGHGAVLHGCTVRRGALVGMLSVIMDGAEIGEESFVGASSFVREGCKVPPRTLALGSPARIVRELKPKEIAWKAHGTRLYQDLAQRCRASLEACEPLPEAEANRPKNRFVEVQTLGTINREP